MCSGCSHIPFAVVVFSYFGFPGHIRGEPWWLRRQKYPSRAGGPTSHRLFEILGRVLHKYRTGYNTYLQDLALLMATKHCQHCNVRLNITGADSFHPEAFPSYRHMANQSLMGASVFGSAKIDDSFVLLDPRVQRVHSGTEAQHGQGMSSLKRWLTFRLAASQLLSWWDSKA